MASLNKLLWLRRLIVSAKYAYYTRVWGMDIHPTAEFSTSVRFDRTFPKGLHIGARSYVAFDVAILCHDRTRGLYMHTRIGENCFVGGRSIILPGVEIGNGCVIGAGSVVTKSIPAGSIAAGNPARVIRDGVAVGPYGRYLTADETEARLRVVNDFPK